MHCASVHDTALNCTVYSEQCIMQCTVHSVSVQYSALFSDMHKVLYFLALMLYSTEVQSEHCIDLAMHSTGKNSN